jgi:hypothetical protein
MEQDAPTSLSSHLRADLNPFYVCTRDDHVYASVWLDDSLVELELCIALDEAENYTTLLSDLWCVAEFLSDNDA